MSGVPIRINEFNSKRTKNQRLGHFIERTIAKLPMQTQEIVLNVVVNDKIRLSPIGFKFELRIKRTGRERRKVSFIEKAIMEKEKREALAKFERGELDVDGKELPKGEETA